MDVAVTSEPKAEIRPPLLVPISLRDFDCRPLRNPVDASFYSGMTTRIAETCGHISGFSDYHSVIDTVFSRDLDLDLDHTSCKTLSLLLHGLSQSNRWAGSLHISAAEGEDSAIHSAMSAVLVNEVFRRAGLLNMNRDEVQSMRLVATLALLLHDMGELAGEFNTVESRSLFNDDQEERLLQRRVFETALRFAVTHLDAPEKFYSVLTDLRRHTSANSAVGTFDKVGLSAALDRNWVPDEALNGTAKLLISKFLYVYDLIEFHDHKDRQAQLVGLVCEAVEHAQGTRHLCRFAPLSPDVARPRFWDPTWVALPDGKESLGTSAIKDQEMLPLRMRANKEFYKMFKYTEGEVPGIMQTALTDFEVALARESQKLVYLTLAETAALGPEFLLCDDKLDVVPVKDLRVKAFAPETDARERHMLFGLIRARLLEEKALLSNWHQGLVPDAFKHSPPVRIVTGAEIAAVYQEAVQQTYMPRDKEILLFSPATFERLLAASELRKLNGLQQAEFNLSLNSLPAHPQ